MGDNRADLDDDRNNTSSDDRYQMLFENNPIVIWEHDFSDSKSYLDSLNVESEGMKSYLNSHPSEVAALFDKVTTIDVNQNAVDYYKAKSKEYLLNNVDQVLDEEAWDLTVDLWNSVSAGETQFRGETVANTFDGERRHQILQLYVPDAYADTYGRVYMTGTDITDLKLREQELQRERDRLDEFASIISHDLRNPLSVAQGHISLAQEDGDPEHLAAAARSIDRSFELIGDLLTLARAGKKVGALETIALSSVIQNCEAQVAGADVTIAGHLPTIKADRTRLSELLENLIRNAVEHGGSNTSITVGSLDAGFYVGDDGDGIPSDDRETVFEPGFSTNSEGTGFGLGIVQQIADAHGWDIRATSGSSGGARFEITGVECLS